MGIALQDAGDVIRALPLPALLFASLVLVLASLAVLRVISNAFPGKQPPTLEGIPFVGGIAKFISVRASGLLLYLHLDLHM
jgi:hypothetical protein